MRGPRIQGTYKLLCYCITYITIVNTESPLLGWNLLCKSSKKGAGFCSVYLHLLYQDSLY